ncbi:hypothetical protein ACIBI9_67500 [Nonomuraea sp. NPDC050451]|uniref:hypothetical protein n=1 Tax=Nonomuraea sp. NPDC050451 TaxID=3364364 RepID=UPI0037B8A35D
MLTSYLAFKELLEGYDPRRFLDTPADLRRAVLQEDPFFAEENVRQRWKSLSPMARLFYTKMLAHVLSK